MHQNEVSASSKLFGLIALVFISLIASTILSLLLLIPFFGLDVLLDGASLNNLENPETLSALKFIQFFNAVGIFIIPPIAFFIVYKIDWKGFLNFKLPEKKVYLLMAVAIVFAISPLINAMVYFNEAIQLPDFLNGLERWMKETESQAATITEAFIKYDSIWVLAVNLLIMAVIPGIGEELLFRGLVQPLFNKITGNIHAAIWITAFLFSALHLQFYGLIPRMFLGAIFGYMYFFSGSIFVPMLGHFINNLVAIIGYILLNKGLVSEDPNKIGISENDYWMTLVSCVLTAFIFYYSFKLRKMPNQEFSPSNQI